LLDAANGKLSATFCQKNTDTTDNLLRVVDENKLNQMLNESPDTHSSNLVLTSKKATVAKTNTPIATAEEEIRVKLKKIEMLNNIVGELVILQTVLDQFRQQNELGNTVNKSIRHLGKISKEIQELSMSFRMIPIKTLFQKHWEKKST
jgi:two-component system chemotaxis sensor kinase CheA